MFRRPKRDHCVFCDAVGVTREHVWPEWIGKLLRERVSPRPYVVQRDGKKWQTSKIDLTVKRVCQETCNGGWMSDLETETTPLLTPMILGDAVGCDLSPDSQLVLARWVAKTVFMADFMYKTALVPPQWYRGYFKHRLPPDQWVIWTGSYSGTRAAIDLRRAHAVLDSIPVGPDGRAIYSQQTKTGAFVFTFNLHRVVFQVLGYAGDHLPLQGPAADGSAQRIWPPHPATFHWPPPVPFDDDGFVAFADRVGTL